MRPAFDALFSRYAAVSFGKQMYLADLVADLNWQLSLDAGSLAFGDRYRWQVQVLGTWSEVANTWLWAWANEASNIPEQIVRAALTMRVLGNCQQITELTAAEFAADETMVHVLAMIASGLYKADGYYRCPYEDGAAFVLIKDDGFPACTEVPLVRLSSVLAQAICEMEVPNHKLALTGYLEYYGIDHQDHGRQVFVKSEGEPGFFATFDALDRLSKVEAAIMPQKT